MPEIIFVVLVIFLNRFALVFLIPKVLYIVGYENNTVAISLLWSFWWLSGILCMVHLIWEFPVLLLIVRVLEFVNLGQILGVVLGCIWRRVYSVEL